MLDAYSAGPPVGPKDRWLSSAPVVILALRAGRITAAPLGPQGGLHRGLGRPGPDTLRGLRPRTGPRTTGPGPRRGHQLGSVTPGSALLPRVGCSAAACSGRHGRTVSPSEQAGIQPLRLILMMSWPDVSLPECGLACTSTASRCYADVGITASMPTFSLCRCSAGCRRSGGRAGSGCRHSHRRESQSRMSGSGR